MASVDKWVCKVACPCVCVLCTPVAPCNYKFGLHDLHNSKRCQFGICAPCVIDCVIGWRNRSNNKPAVRRIIRSCANAASEYDRTSLTSTNAGGWYGEKMSPKPKHAWVACCV